MLTVALSDRDYVLSDPGASITLGAEATALDY